MAIWCDSGRPQKARPTVQPYQRSSRQVAKLIRRFMGLEQVIVHLLCGSQVMVSWIKSLDLK
jgi:hypothetical protein